MRNLSDIAKLTNKNVVFLLLVLKDRQIHLYADSIAKQKLNNERRDMITD